MRILRRFHTWLLVRFNLWLAEERQADAGHVMPDFSKPRGPWVRRWRDGAEKANPAPFGAKGDKPFNV